MSHIVLRENASKRSSWKQLDDLALEYNAKEEKKYIRRSMVLARSNKLPTSLATMTNRRTFSCSAVTSSQEAAILAMEELENALADILDEAEQVISSTGESSSEEESQEEMQQGQQQQQQELLVENASSRPQEDTNNKRTSLYGFETDSTWDDFCNELSVDE